MHPALRIKKNRFSPQRFIKTCQQAQHTERGKNMAEMEKTFQGRIRRETGKNIRVFCTVQREAETK